MMKKRAISIVLALLLLLSLALTGCGDKTSSKEKDDESDNKVETVKKDRDDEDEDRDDEDKKTSKKKKKDDEKIIGDWNMEMEMADILNEQFENQGLGDYLNVSSYPVRLAFTFEEDGTFSCDVDEKAFSRDTDDVIDELKDDMVDYFEDMIAEEGLDMTVDELFETMGTTLDEMMDESIDKDEMYESIAGLDAEGEYTIEDGELSWTTGGDGKTFAYSFEDDDTLVLESVIEGYGDETFEAMLPLTLTRD